MTCMKKHVKRCNILQVADMVNASDRRPELGYQSALNIAMARKIVAAQST